jgi:hypothetical protein
MQDCCKHFKNIDDLKWHLMEEQECEQAIVDNYEVYAISQLYHKNFVWWIKGKKELFLKVERYWKENNKCMFKHFQYEHQDSLYSSFD